MGNDKTSLKRRIKELEQANKDLEKKLEWEKTKSLVYKKLIEIAEEDLDTDISKKDGAGRFRK